MTRFVVIWSLKCGSIDPPEPLDAEGQRAANLEAESYTVAPYQSVRYLRMTAEQAWIESLSA
jgi:hypothetical protein